MNKTNIKCPRCHSSKLSKFGYDMQANQKYQCKKYRRQFAPFFNLKADILKKNLNLESDDWHADETVVFINGQRYYLWLAIDSETRFVLAFHLTKSRAEDSAFSFVNKAKEFG